MRDKKAELYTRYEAGEENLYDEVLKLYEEALTKEPENTEYLHRYGFLYERMGKKLLRKAATIYEKGIEIALKPENLNIREKQHCHGQLISLRSKLGESQKSIDLYKDYIRQHPDKVDGYCHLAHAYLKADQIDEAKQCIEVGYKLNPKNPSVNSWMGEIYARIGKFDEALQYYKTAVEIDPIYVSCRFGRAYLFEKLYRIEEAISEWNLIITYLKQNYGDADAKFAESELKRIEENFQNKPSQ
jgi:tetratricopeptide (TPR) repeat protein